MSAICGLYSLKQEKIDSGLLNHMVDILQQWGPDWQSSWVQNEVGLGQAILITTPEAKENQHSVFKLGHLYLVADCRLDNRKELLDFLEIHGVPNQEKFSDEEIILQIYQLLGQDCPSKLVGDFAFAIWDDEKKELFCARDPLGMRPFFYKRDGRTFTFSSHIRAFHPIYHVQNWNLNYLADYLYLKGNSSDYDTPYLGVYRLPRGTFLKLNRDQFEIHSYWRLEDTKPIRYKNDNDYIEHFQEVFYRSVQERLRSMGSIAVMMSGGLDSTSIYSVAKKNNPDLTIIPISCVFDQYEESDERKYIQMVLDQYKVKDYDHVVSDDLWMLKNYPRYTPQTDEPVLAQLTYALTSSTYKKAAERKVKVALTGYAGDQVFGFHRAYISDYLKKFRLWSFFREANNLAKSYSETMFTIIKDHGIKPLLTKDDEHPLLLPEHYRKTKKRYKEVYEIHEPGRRAQYEYINQARNFHFAQHYISEPLGMETRHPFLDLRLIEFLYNIPVEQKIKDAQTKILLRKSLQGTLPDGVIHRLTKTSNNHLTFDGLKHEWGQLYPILRNPILEELGLVYKNRLLKQIDLYRHGEISRGMEFYSALSLELWLREHMKPEVSL